MEITKVTPIFIDRYLLVKIDTDAGISGIGESGAWGYLEASSAAIEKYGRYLVGQDPLRIEHHWQYMYRFSHFRGAAIMGALSAIDIALWDIFGQSCGLPVFLFWAARHATESGSIIPAWGTVTTAIGALSPAPNTRGSARRRDIWSTRAPGKRKTER